MRENTDTTSETITLAPCFYEAIVRFAAFRELRSNWDSYGADPIREDAIEAATDLFSEVQDRFLKGRDSAPFGLPEKPARVVPLDDGGIQVEWIGPLGELQVQVGPSGGLEYLQVLGFGENRRFTERDSASTEEVLSRLAQVLQQ